jgi:FtsH-binding integral membrane protein
MSLNDQILADRQKTWHGVGRLLFWGTIHCLVLTLIVVLFAMNGPTATTWAISIIIFLINLAITAFALLTRK